MIAFPKAFVLVAFIGQKALNMYYLIVKVVLRLLGPHEEGAVHKKVDVDFSSLELCVIVPKAEPSQSKCWNKLLGKENDPDISSDPSVTCIIKPRYLGYTGGKLRVTI